MAVHAWGSGRFFVRGQRDWEDYTEQTQMKKRLSSPDREFFEMNALIIIILSLGSPSFGVGEQPAFFVEPVKIFLSLMVASVRFSY